MSEGEEYHDLHVGDVDSEGEEVAFKTTAATSSIALITRSDLEEIIEGWKEKFRKITDGMRAIEQATEEAHTHMDSVMRDSRAHDSDTHNRIKQIQEGLARFIERCDPAHPTPVRPFATPCAPKMNTPITPSGVHSRYRSDFPFLRPLLTRTHLQGPRAVVWTMTLANDLRTRMNMETAATPSTYRLTTVAG